MAKVYIDGHVFETGKAAWHADILRFDQQSNRITGDVYESSTGIFYVYTPSQWSNMHDWVIMEPTDILNKYGEDMSEDDAEYLIKQGNVQIE